MMLLPGDEVPLYNAANIILQTVYKPESSVKIYIFGPQIEGNKISFILRSFFSV